MSKTTSITVFLDGDGKITRLPVPNRTRLPVLAYLAEKFEPGRDYTEKEVNALLSAWHTFGDFFILRRLLIDHRFLARVPDGSRYWVLEQEVPHPSRRTAVPPSPKGRQG